MGADFYRHFETPLDREVDKAIAEANAAFLADPKAQSIAQENGERWRCITEAERAAGCHGVVLPLATAKAILALLHGETNDLEEMSEGLTARMLTVAIQKAEDRL